MGYMVRTTAASIKMILTDYSCSTQLHTVCALFFVSFIWFLVSCTCMFYSQWTSSHCVGDCFGCDAKRIQRGRLYAFCLKFLSRNVPCCIHNNIIIIHIPTWELSGKKGNLHFIVGGQKALCDVSVLFVRFISKLCVAATAIDASETERFNNNKEKHRSM